MQKKARLRREISRLKIDGLLVTDIVNVRYLTGFTGSSGYVVINGKYAVFVTDFRYEEQARDEVRGFHIEIEHSERTEEIRDIAHELRIRRLGFEAGNVSYALFRKLQKRKIRLKPLTDTVEYLRIVKSAYEVECIRAAVRRAERAFRRLLPLIKPGVTELKLAVKLESLLKDEGCKSLPFEVIVASGSRSALPHAQPTNKTVKKGDLIVIDWGGEYEGYFSDMTRTVLVRGRDMAKQKEIYAIVSEAQLRAIAAVKSGVRASTVDSAARDLIKHKGYGDNFGHGTGHGVGLQVHEQPSVSWRSRDVLTRNMVLTIEPGIYVPGFGGVRIEDMVTVSGSKARVFNKLSKKIKIIG
jgi:Xaa-Pro aminopeptidase